MNCDRYEDQIHLYVDHRLDKRETEELLKHMETCTHCQETYEEISALKDLLGGMQMKELPKGFEEELHVKLVEASNEKEVSWLDKLKESFKNNTRTKMVVSFASVALAAVLVVGNTGLIPSMNQFKTADEAAYESSEAYYGDDFATEEATEAAPAMAMMTTAGPEIERKADIAVTFDESVDVTSVNGVTNYALSAEESVDGQVTGVGDSQVNSNGKLKAKESSNEFTGRLIIKTANLSLDIENYDETNTELYRMVEDMGGYISDTSSYYYIYDRYDEENNKKSGYLTLRIPHHFFDQFVSQMNEFGVVTNFSSNANDITKQYRDTSAEVKNLEVREAKLREIMDRAELIEDVIEVERELSRVRSEINRYQSILTDWEDLVSLSTVTINMTEVEDLKIYVKPVDKDVFTKAKEGFIYTINRMIDSLELFFVWLIASSPVLLPVGLIGGFTLRKFYKRWKK